MARSTNTLLPSLLSNRGDQCGVPSKHRRLLVRVSWRQKVSASGAPSSANYAGTTPPIGSTIAPSPPNLPPSLLVNISHGQTHTSSSLLSPPPPLAIPPSSSSARQRKSARPPASPKSAPSSFPPLSRVDSKGKARVNTITTTTAATTPRGGAPQQQRPPLSPSSSSLPDGSVGQKKRKAAADIGHGSKPVVRPSDHDRRSPQSESPGPMMKATSDSVRDSKGAGGARGDSSNKTPKKKISSNSRPSPQQINPIATTPAVNPAPTIVASSSSPPLFHPAYVYHDPPKDYQQYFLSPGNKSAKGGASAILENSKTIVIEAPPMVYSRMAHEGPTVNNNNHQLLSQGSTETENGDSSPSHRKNTVSVNCSDPRLRALMFSVALAETGSPERSPHTSVVGTTQSGVPTTAAVSPRSLSVIAPTQSLVSANSLIFLDSCLHALSRQKGEHVDHVALGRPLGYQEALVHIPAMFSDAYAKAMKAPPDAGKLAGVSITNGGPGSGAGGGKNPKGESSSPTTTRRTSSTAFGLPDVAAPTRQRTLSVSSVGSANTPRQSTLQDPRRLSTHSNMVSFSSTTLNLAGKKKAGGGGSTKGPSVGGWVVGDCVLVDLQLASTFGADSCVYTLSVFDDDKYLNRDFVEVKVEILDAVTDALIATIPIVPYSDGADSISVVPSNELSAFTSSPYEIPDTEDLIVFPQAIVPVTKDISSKQDQSQHHVSVSSPTTVPTKRASRKDASNKRGGNEGSLGSVPSRSLFALSTSDPDIEVPGGSRTPPLPAQTSRVGLLCRSMAAFELVKVSALPGAGVKPWKGRSQPTASVDNDDGPLAATTASLFSTQQVAPSAGASNLKSMWVLRRVCEGYNTHNPTVLHAVVEGRFASLEPSWNMSPSIDRTNSNSQLGALTNKSASRLRGGLAAGQQPAKRSSSALSGSSSFDTAASSDGDDLPSQPRQPTSPSSTSLSKGYAINNTRAPTKTTRDGFQSYSRGRARHGGGDRETYGQYHRHYRNQARHHRGLLGGGESKDDSLSTDDEAPHIAATDSVAAVSNLLATQRPTQQCVSPHRPAVTSGGGASMQAPLEITAARAALPGFNDHATVIRYGASCYNAGSNEDKLVEHFEHHRRQYVRREARSGGGLSQPSFVPTKESSARARAANGSLMEDMAQAKGLDLMPESWLKAMTEEKSSKRGGTKKAGTLVVTVVDHNMTSSSIVDVRGETDDLGEQQAATAISLVVGGEQPLQVTRPDSAAQEASKPPLPPEMVAMIERNRQQEPTPNAPAAPTSPPPKQRHPNSGGGGITKRGRHRRREPPSQQP